ncbi:hypothetical protein [Agromyces sp. NPDC055661]
MAIEGLNLVLRGAFTPILFSPAWFKERGLIGEPELAAAGVEVIAGEIASFRLGWLGVHVTPDGFQVSTSEVEEFPRLRDVALGALRLLEQTPLGALGINRNFHTIIGSSTARHRIGDTIVPKEIWNDTLVLPGMRSATLWGVRPDGYSGHFQVQVEPSFQVTNGIYVGANDHFNLTVDPNPPQSREDFDREEEVPDPTPTLEKRTLALKILTEEWTASMGRAEAAHARVISFSEGLS